MDNLFLCILHKKSLEPNNHKGFAFVVVQVNNLAKMYLLKSLYSWEKKGAIVSLKMQAMKKEGNGQRVAQSLTVQGLCHL